MRHLILLCLFLAACGSGSGGAGGSGGGGGSVRTVSLFSRWTAPNGSVIDMNGMTFGNNAITIAETANSGCNCTATITGDNGTGSASVFNCSHYGPGGNTCSGGTTVYTYVNYNATLNLCNGASCTLYTTP